MTPSGTGPSRRVGLAAITTTAILWGTTGTVATFADGAGPLAIGAAALGIGGLLQAAVAIPALRAARGELSAHRRTILLGAAAVAIYPLAFYSSMHLAGVAVGTVVSLACAPLASGVLELVVDRRALSRWWTLAAALGILGSILLCLATQQSSAGSVWLTVAGVLLGLVAGTTYAVYSWVVHRLMSAGVSRSAFMGAVFGLGEALLMPVLVLTGAPLLASGTNLAVAAYMALVPMFLGYVLFGIGLTAVSASEATTVTLSEPAVAAVLAVVVVGEQLGTVGWIGVAIIGLVLVVLAAAPTNAAVPPAGRASVRGEARQDRAKQGRPTGEPLLEVGSTGQLEPGVDTQPAQGLGLPDW